MKTVSIIEFTQKAKPFALFQEIYDWEVTELALDDVVIAADDEPSADTMWDMVNEEQFSNIKAGALF